MIEMEAIDEQLIVTFLLGELSEDSRLKIEERVFEDDRFYEQVLAIQEELADDYVQDKQPSAQRAQFERYFLQSHRRRERVEFAAAFSRALAEPDARVIAEREESSVGRWGLLLAFVRPRLAMATAAAAALILLIGASWLYVQNRRLSNGLEQARGERDKFVQESHANDAEAERKRQELEREIAALRAQGGDLETRIQEKQRELEALQRTRKSTASQPSSVIATFTLLPGLTREANEPEKLIIPATVRSIQLQLNLEREEKYQSYVAEIRTTRGNLILSKSGLAAQRTPSGPAVSLTIPEKFLATGEYEVALKGAAQGKLEAVGYYYFIALKR